MARQMLIYENAVPVDATAHRDLSLRPGAGYDFARHLGAVPVVAAEFAATAFDFAIVFGGGEDGTLPFAVLGIENDRNLYVAPDGSWDARYVPAFLRRYPFVFARDASSDTLALCIDDRFEGLNRDGIGERLFDTEGNRTQFLEGMVGFVAQYQTQFLRTRQFCIRLEQLDLLEPVAASVPGPDTGPDPDPARIAGIRKISRERLKRISEDDLRKMFATDELELCYIHLQSLNNLERLRARAAA